MKQIKKILVVLFKRLEIASAIAVRLTKFTGKAEQPIHPKHLVTSKLWFAKYLQKQDVVLDLGCGNGQNTLKASKFVKTAIGVDYDNSLLNVARKTAKTKNVDFKKLNLEDKLPFKNNTYDKVIFLDVLEHLHKRNQVIWEIKRVLKKNGQLFISVPNSGTSWKKLQREVGICSFSDPDHKIEYSENQIRNFLKNNNLDVISFKYGKYDTPLRPIYDLIGVFSLNLYKSILILRQKRSNQNPQEASGFEIVSANRK